MRSSTETTTQPILSALREIGQDHVLRWWDELDPAGRQRLLQQVARIDLRLLVTLAKGVQEGRFTPVRGARGTLPEYIRLPRTLEEELEREAARRTGEQRVRDGRVAVLTVAGGQGTRLGYDGPKGTFPIGPVTGKSLFQIHAERIAAARRRYHSSIPWYVMTSDATHEATERFFQSHGYFGLPREDVRFFRQGVMPALDRNLRLVMLAKDQILLSPNGHGGVFAALRDSGILDEMSARRIEDISYFQVDNPLVPAVDPVFLGFHCLMASQMSSKAVWKREPEEPIGAFVRVDSRLVIREYIELTPEDMVARDESGALIYGLGSPAIHLISVEFARRIASNDDLLPWHLAEKRSPFLDENGRVVEPETKNVYKFEKFVFDALPHAEQTLVMEVDRRQEFSPLKNAEGPDSPATCRADMTALYADWLTAAGVAVPCDDTGRPLHPVEISPLYALDADELLYKVPRDLRVEGPLYLGPM